MESSFLLFSNPPGRGYINRRPGVPSDAAQGAHYPAGTRGLFKPSLTPASVVQALTPGRDAAPAAPPAPGHSVARSRASLPASPDSDPTPVEASQCTDSQTAQAVSA